MPHVIARDDRAPAQKIVVVGAGPAGLEAARVSAERGHEVILFEAASKPGGQIRLAAQVPRRTRTDRHRRLARRRNASASASTMRYNTYAEADDLRGLDADIVMIATGGLPQNLADRGRRGSRGVELGHPVRRREAGRGRAALRRQRRPSRHGGGEVRRRFRRAARARQPRALLRARDGRPQPRALHAELRLQGREDHHHDAGPRL